MSSISLINATLVCLEQIKYKKALILLSLFSFGLEQRRWSHTLRSTTTSSTFRCHITKRLKRNCEEMLWFGKFWLNYQTVRLCKLLPQSAFTSRELSWAFMVSHQASYKYKRTDGQIYPVLGFRKNVQACHCMRCDVAGNPSIANALLVTVAYIL